MKLLVLLGDVATKAKGTYAAIDYYKQAVDFGTRLLDINPNDVILLASLAHPLEQAGLSALSNGDWATAEKYLSEAVTVIHKMADVNGMFKRGHAFILTKLATAKEEMDKLDEALQYYTMGMQITKELLSASPDDGKLKWNMSVSYERIGHIAELKHNYREAELLYRQSLEIRRTNVKLGLDRLMKTLLQVRYTDLVHFRCSERQWTSRKNTLKKRCPYGKIYITQREILCTRRIMILLKGH